MTYFLVAYLCISAPIAVWVFLSVEGRFRQVIVGVVYAVISVLVMACFPGGTDKSAAKHISMIDWIGGENDKRLRGCNGWLDALTAGFRPVDPNQQQKVMVAAGKRLVLEGWMGSPLTQSQVPVIKLVQMGGAKREVTIPATSMERPDVVAFYKNSSLNRSGFHAEGILPGDLPLGDYQIIAECRSGEEWDQYTPSFRISVVPHEVVEPLDAPYERAAAQAAQQALQAAQKQVVQKSAGIQKDKAPKPQKKSRTQSREGLQGPN
jgi:hypothetical protein